MKYYKVVAHRAHQGCGRTTPITFYIQADNAIKASSIAQSMAGVTVARLLAVFLLQFPSILKAAKSVLTSGQTLGGNSSLRALIC